MKRLLIITALVFVGTALATAYTQPKQKGPGQALIQIELELEKGTLKLDPSPYDRYWADDFVGIDAFGNFYTKAQHRSALTSGKLKFESFNIDEMNVRVFGETAVLTDRRTVKYRYEDKETNAQSRVTSVFVKRNGKWQKVAEHTSRVIQ